MLGPPRDVEGERNARLLRADDYGDNVCSVRCQLPEGHDGPHGEEFDRSGKPVVITCNADERGLEDDQVGSYR
jgi:hypothetical protein